jgi:hypothetical protein
MSLLWIFAGVFRKGALCHDLRRSPAAPDHRLDRYTAVIVLVPNPHDVPGGRSYRMMCWCLGLS